MTPLYDWRQDGRCSANDDHIRDPGLILLSMLNPIIAVVEEQKPPAKCQAKEICENHPSQHIVKHLQLGWLYAKQER